jgi:glycerol-3-phosphate acyltransferase PlsY
MVVHEPSAQAMRNVAAPVVAAAVGYLLGTIPSADIATRLARSDVDVRAHGSGNPGALNTATVLGTHWGAAVLVADMATGAAAGVVGRAIAGPAGAYAAATASIAGHIVPVWSGGRGGKGVATSAGASLAVFPVYFPIDAAVAAATAAAGHNAERAIMASSTVWVLAALLWWRRRLPNAWGPAPTVGLPLFAIAGSAMIVAKFRAARRSQ